MSQIKEYASVDLGSNSFHLVTATLDDGQLVILDKLKERVRLAAGLTAKNNLTTAVQEKALECLDRFGHRLAHMPKAHVRVVGTNTLRKARNADAFIEKAQALLGREVEIISGLEEARLIYNGVTQFLPEDNGKRLVVDIGGGSTECIIGKDRDIEQADSFYMGCVEFTQRFFPGKKWTHEHFLNAVTAARLQIGPVQRKYKSIGWSNVYGSSGTINAVGEVLRVNNMGTTITRSGIDWLYGYMQGARSLDGLNLAGLKPERAPVFVGGVCILWALFHGMKIKSMVPVSTALREGVLWELAGLEGHGDIREASVNRLVRRFAADREHADIVRTMVEKLGPPMLKGWGLHSRQNLNLLDWAAQLHEIGKSIQYSGYHKHSAYLVKNSHLAGFSRQDQNVLAAMLLCHRRKIDRSRIQEYAGLRTDEVMRLSIILRLAVLLCRTRSKRARPEVKVTVGEQKVTLKFPAGYLQERPLTQADLAQESTELMNADFKLRVQSLPSGP